MAHLLDHLLDPFAYVIRCAIGEHIVGYATRDGEFLPEDLVYLENIVLVAVEDDTSLRELDNMALTSINVTRDKDSGRILDATIGLRQVVIATTEVTEPPEPRQKNRSKKRQTGKQTTKTPDASLAAKRPASAGVCPRVSINSWAVKKRSKKR